MAHHVLDVTLEPENYTTTGDVTSSGDEDDSGAARSWLIAHALPWVWRRLRGRTAGDGLSAKHTDYVVLPGLDRRRAPTT